jgi:hypothetical protein
MLDARGRDVATSTNKVETCQGAIQDADGGADGNSCGGDVRARNIRMLLVVAMTQQSWRTGVILGDAVPAARVEETSLVRDEFTFTGTEA